MKKEKREILKDILEKISKEIIQYYYLKIKLLIQKRRKKSE